MNFNVRTSLENFSISEKERRVAHFVLDGLQSRLSLLVGRQEMEAEAETSLDTTWLRRGNLACRLNVTEEE